jgi:uncharacterized protein (DUF433 family)
VSDAELLARITLRPEQCGGRPCIRGMRIRVSDVLSLLASGAPKTEILATYPYLEPDDIAACLLYVARRVDDLCFAAQVIVGAEPQPANPDLEDEQRWSEAFARSRDRLAELAAEAREEHRAGRTLPLDSEGT